MLGVNTNINSQVAINSLAQNEQRMSTAMNRLVHRISNQFCV